MKKNHNYIKDEKSNLILPQTVINELEVKRFGEELDRGLLSQKIEETKKFEMYYINLYNKLHERFQIEFNNIHGLENKCDFLQELMDSIIRANHNIKYNFNVSELCEESEKDLIGLFKFFENEMQSLFYKNGANNKLEEETPWFKAGICFAQGKMEKYLSNGVKSANWSAPEIAKELNLPECEKYFLASLNNYTLDNRNSSKNIFNSSKRIEKIIKFCNEKKIEIAESFINRYNEIKDKNS